LLAGFGYLAEKGFGVLESEKLDEVMGDAARAFNRNRVRLLNYFSVLAQAAPMVGLLGTVSGMIKAFANLGREGMGDPSKLAANISEALITTATGLIIALPAIFCYHLFKDRLQNLVHECDEKIIEQMTHLRRAVAAYDAQQSGHETSD
jgi:biopolymer transport protein ExbB